MKKSIFMYLFFFAVLFIIFQYMNEKRIFESQEKTIQKLTEQVSEKETIQETLIDSIATMNYFSLRGNDDAMTYIEKLGMEAIDAENKVRDFIYDQNTGVNGNPLIPYEGIEAPMRVNSLKFLNHRWVMADFTDGSYWGEMILEYYFDENNELDVQVLGSVLYGNPKPKKN